MTSNYIQIHSKHSCYIIVTFKYVNELNISCTFRVNSNSLQNIQITFKHIRNIYDASKIHSCIFTNIHYTFKYIHKIFTIHLDTPCLFRSQCRSVGPQQVLQKCYAADSVFMLFLLLEFRLLEFSVFIFCIISCVSSSTCHNVSH